MRKRLDYAAWLHDLGLQHVFQGRGRGNLNAHCTLTIGIALLIQLHLIGSHSCSPTVIDGRSAFVQQIAAPTNIHARPAILADCDIAICVICYTRPIHHSTLARHPRVRSRQTPPTQKPTTLCCRHISSTRAHLIIMSAATMGRDQAAGAANTTGA